MNLPRPIRVKIAAKLMSMAFALLMLWVFGKVIFWIEPTWVVLNTGFLAVMAVDFALIVSGIRPRGFLTFLDEKNDEEE